MNRHDMVVAIFVSRDGETGKNLKNRRAIVDVIATIVVHPLVKDEQHPHTPLG